MPQDFSEKHIVESVQGSLKRLQTDYIDLYQLHSPTIETIQKEENIIPTLMDLKKEGIIKEYGISVRSPDDALIAVRDYNYPVIQVNFNLIDHRAIENGLFDLCKKQKNGIIARTPFCFGYLTGSLKADEKFKGEDHRKKWPDKQKKIWAESPVLFNNLNKGKNRSQVQLALKFCLAYDTISTVIPGMMNSDEVKENTAASDLPDLTTEELSEIQKIYETHKFYDKNFIGKR